MSLYKDVRTFTETFDLCPKSWLDTPGRLPKKLLQERIDFLQEELDELRDARDDASLSGQFDALLDLVYVAIGTAIMMGLPWQRGWDLVHAANMKKRRGVTHRGHEVDLVKPPGWEPPDLEALLQSADGALPPRDLP